jgi:hypothetical protein
MTKAKFDEVESELVHGVRYSLDGSQVVAKLADGQQIERAGMVAGSTRFD